jgi:Tol biopolymer transport system component
MFANSQIVTLPPVFTDWRCAKSGLSADGRYVSVVSNATNVANPGTPGRDHAFVFDRATAQATRISVKPDGTEPDRDCVFPAISSDGSLVTFVSRATNLPTAAPPDTDSI